MTARATLAERKRQLVAEELRNAAMMLMATRGFEQVTVDDIAATAGMSRRTFFRYYASKEDVVVRFIADMGADVLDELTGRPAGEPPSVALRHAIWRPLAGCADQPDHAERSRIVVRLILDTPALHARWLERQIEWRAGLSTGIAARRGLDPEAGPYPSMAAGMALLALDAVLQQWQPGDDETRLAELTDRAFAVVAPALDA
ncbi:putative TetR-family transcriptional regulator [Actinoplanes missouriensis 431]|uniref:Putative TetR-family transcriptional regulator n=1 Tax=Actinoplanes missouriensis (strain ATCC 14538 / DSM 43046 / CBS 188.64 / JCM 3121 / NBRC 102363 / NCIMB 12654 / NRRL B-3342 / UNCC 431) TaxID=512565 RepID=I0HDV9_ACTM4|nr:TetR family transcriptional regulator [Actinoplanes missouriensis]BAL91196.1 putative TetR-family transcriptional regulator [Actinoplanes missouriensis 431]